MARRHAPPRYPLAVVGPGALGLFFASRLSRVVPTAVIARSAERAAELRAGVRIGGRLYRAEAFGPRNPPRAESVLLLVKSYDTAAALRAAARMKPRRVLSLQNGLVEGVAQGVTTAAAYRDGARVVPIATGETLVPPGFAALAALLRRAGFAARVSRHIGAARYRKLLANVCINPVTAIFGVRNGAIRKPPYSRFAQALALEAARVLSAQGLRISPARAIARVMGVARRTAANRSSMLQDVLAGRRTEIEHLNGALLRLGRRHGIELPMHAAMVQMIRSIGKG